MPSATVSRITANADNHLRTAQANAAPRCEHVRYNGDRCGCPALRGDTRCRFHVHADPTYIDDIPLPEDPAAIQLAIFRILRALLSRDMDTKMATALLYGLQLASSNLKRLDASFSPKPAEEEARERSLVEDLLAKLEDDQFIARLNGEDVGDIQAAADPDSLAPTAHRGSSAPLFPPENIVMPSGAPEGRSRGTSRLASTEHEVPPLRAEALRSG